MRPRVISTRIDRTRHRGLHPRRWTWALLYLRGIDGPVEALFGFTWTHAGANGAITRAAARLRRQHGGAR